MARDGSSDRRASLARGRRRHSLCTAPCTGVCTAPAGGFVRDLRRASRGRRRARVRPASRCYSRRAGRPPGRPPPAICRRTLPAEEPTAPAVTDGPRPHLDRASRTSCARRSRRHVRRSGSRRCGPSALEGDVLVVEAPARAPRLGRRALRRACCRPAPRRSSARRSTVDVRSARGRDARPRRRADAREPPADAARPSDGLNPKLTFEQFVIGDANRFAHAAALAVAELPGQAYNPLFIYGPPGVGKTHLLHSIGNYVRALRRRRSRVRYTTVETFTNAVPRRAARAATSTRFKGRYRHADVLLIDDVQFLASQGQDRGGVLPHLQRAARRRQPARPDLRPPPARPRRPRGPPARALRGRPRHRHRAARPRHAHRPSCASASSTTASTSPTTASSRSSPTASPDNVRALEGALIRVVAYASLTGRAARPPTSPAEVLDDLYPARREQAGARRAAHRRAHPGHHRRGVRPHARRAALRRAAPPAWPGRARSPCTSRASTPARRSPPSARASAGATTPPSCTPAGAPPQRIAADPEAFDFVRRLTERLRRRFGADGRQFSPT